MNVLSLFSGIGGLDLGLQRAGMTIAGQVEIDPWCRRVLAKHWPEVPRHDDVRTCAAWWGGRAAPDLVCGGFPCQPVSLVGPRKGQADSRWLWPAFAAVVRELRPGYVLVENTPGLTSLGMGTVVGELAAPGYDAEWDCLPAVWVGAPHIRERIFLVAYPGSSRRRQDAGGAPGHEGEDAGRPAQDDHLAGRDGQSRRTGTMADADREPLGWPSEPRCERDFWADEPRVGRVADGIPGRVDRLRGLGNAVVPQVAEHIGRLIMDAERAA